MEVVTHNANTYDPATKITKSLEHGFDTFGKDCIASLETDLGLVYGKEEKLLYEDNCKLNSDGITPKVMLVW